MAKGSPRKVTKRDPSKREKSKKGKKQASNRLSKTSELLENKHMLDM